MTVQAWRSFCGHVRGYLAVALVDIDGYSRTLCGLACTARVGASELSTETPPLWHATIYTSRFDGVAVCIIINLFVCILGGGYGGGAHMDNYSSNGRQFYGRGGGGGYNVRETKVNRFIILV